MSKIAHILTLKKSTVESVVGIGAKRMDDDILAAILAGQAWIGPRDHLENDPDFLQIIPYVVVMHGDHVLSYRRGSGSGEARLAGKDSIGLGGHVDVADVVGEDATVMEKGQSVPTGRIGVMATVIAAMQRELFEEAGITITNEMMRNDPSLVTFSYVIQANDTVTDSVHLGLVVVVHVDRIGGMRPSVFEDVIADAQFSDPVDLRAGRSPMGDFRPETWTRLLLDVIVAERAQGIG